jgi:hypothetical protein
MPDPDGKTKADADAIPDTSLHGYKEGRKDEIKGDADKLESNDPKDQQASHLEGDDELELPAEKH